MSKTRPPLILVAVLLLLVGISAVFLYMSATAPVHKHPNDVPSVALSAPPRQWSEAVAEARQIARTGLLEQNLPGLSVAVGTSNELVWAEGFGLADLENRVPVKPDHRFRIGTASTVLTSV